MLYLEDYLEMIEHLPQELTDRFTEMRELDLTVQNSMDVLQKKERAFFLQCKRGELIGEAAEQEHQALRREYYKVMEDADEKVNIATQTHDLVERYLRRLDSELFKFKCELEADNNGITEILEKRSLEMDNNSSSAANALLNVLNMNQKENRYYGSTSIGTAGSHLNHVAINNTNVTSTSNPNMSSITLPTTPTSNRERYKIPKVEKRRLSGVSNASVPEKRTNLNSSLSTTTTPAVAIMRPIASNTGPLPVLNVNTVSAPPPVAYNLQQIGPSATSAIAAAASQAIVATQQMQQGRRTASLKASYEAIHGAGGGPTELWINRDITNAATAAAHTTLSSTASVERKHKKRSSTNMAISGPLPNPATPSSTLSIASSPSVSVDSLDMLSTNSSGGSTGALPTLGLAPTISNSSQNLNRATTVNSNNISSTVTSTSAPSIGINDPTMVVDQNAEGDWSYDPNEPRYCTCNQVSYGDMVACDNDNCPYEWFHYPCVGITQPPKGKWYCPKCTASMRRRGNRKN